MSYFEMAFKGFLVFGFIFITVSFIGLACMYSIMDDGFSKKQAIEKVGGKVDPIMKVSFWLMIFCFVASIVLY